MPELVEQMYCSQQIIIPPKFPYILKRYCKSAIKTQPYDLLRWSFEYFRALSLNRTPPVKLRLEYPIYSTEGGLTRGCLKVLANQLSGAVDVPLTMLKQAWGGFCLDPSELQRILCLCEVHMRMEFVPFLHFIAVAAGLLTKCLTHTMILLCETLTNEPDGGSAWIPVQDFLTMYLLLARMDASHDIRYLNGYREGHVPEVEEEQEEEEMHMELSVAQNQRLKQLSATKVEDESMIAGRQMSTTSGEFIVHHIEREIMGYINEQIAILPDPDLKKKKAKPEEVEMIRNLIEEFMEENFNVMFPEVEVEEEEEAAIPEIILVYAVPGIGPIVDEEIIKDFEDYIKEVCKLQTDVFMPRNLRHFMCPPLEKYIEYNYQEEEPKNDQKAIPESEGD